MNKDVLIIILSYLDQPTIAECRLINQLFNRAVINEHLWNHLCNRDYIDSHAELKQETFYETYKLCYGLDNLKWIGYDIHYNPSILHKYNAMEYTNYYPEKLNKRESFPSVICKMKNLQQLSFAYYNNIIEVPKEICNLTNLHRLTLHRIDLQSFPNGIQKLVNLTYIDLSMNQLTEFPIDIYDITRLVTINIHANKIVNIPEEITQLINLETIDLSWNMIKGLPKRMHTMINLRYVDLSNNLLTEVPEFVCRLRNLNHVSLRGNLIKVRLDL